MKIALYIEDGLEQVVLTPESETEKGILGKLRDGSREMSLKRGTFYGCRGGWTRHRDTYPTLHGLPEREDDSTMVVLTPAKPKEPELAPAFAGPHPEFVGRIPTPDGILPEVHTVAEALRDECFKVFGSKWSYDVSWSFARAAIAALNPTTPTHQTGGPT